MFLEHQFKFQRSLSISSYFSELFLVHTPIGKFFNDIAFALTGRFTGGTAKAAVVASALQGTVSGSSVGNTVAIRIIYNSNDEKSWISHRSLQVQQKLQHQQVDKLCRR